MTTGSIIRNVRVRNWTSSSSSSNTTTNSNNHRNKSNSQRKQHQQQKQYYTTISSWIVCALIIVVIVVITILSNTNTTTTTNSLSNKIKKTLHMSKSDNNNSNNDNYIHYERGRAYSKLYDNYLKSKQQQRKKKKKNGKQQQQEQEPRIAMLLPYTSIHDSTTTTTTNSKKKHVQQQQHQQHDDPYSTDMSSSSLYNNNYASIVSTFTLFCYSVAATADIMDFYIFHTGIVTSSSDNTNNSTTTTTNRSINDIQSDTILSLCPPNVIFVNVNDYRGMAEYLLRVVDIKYNSTTMDKEFINSIHNQINVTQPIMKYNELLDIIESYIKMNPYGLVEFKPALGHIFMDYIPTNIYTHWGYTDYDIIFGDIRRWITQDELYDYNIVTYTFGDQQRLYVRGQFTIHQNQHSTINQLWRKCHYLSNIDQRFDSIIQKTTKYHVESAEGCYSHVLLQEPNISIKFAVKAWTDIYNTDPAYMYGIGLSRSRRSGRQIIYKYENNNTIDTIDTTSIYNLRDGWFEDPIVSPQYSKGTIVDIQQPIGERIVIDQPFHDTKPCMYWAISTYQTNLCLRDNVVTSNDIIYYINGTLYKQPYSTIKPIHSNNERIITIPIFHYQEWKRSYRYEQVASILSTTTTLTTTTNNNNNNMEYDSSTDTIQTFLLLPEGVIPMIALPTKSSSSSKSSMNKIDNVITEKVSSPLGISNMQRYWPSYDTTYNHRIHHNILPLPTYCIKSRLDGSHHHSICDVAISWHDTSRMIVLVHAPNWKTIPTTSSSTDVTLVLTLQFASSWDIGTNEKLVHSVIDNAIMNINRWYGQPCVLLISIPYSILEKNMEYLYAQFDITKNPNYESCFIAVIPHDLTKDLTDSSDDDTISRKALMNMAIDIVPTRWYVSGIELERGLVLSTDTSYMAHRTAIIYSTVRGNIFIIPQFGTIDVNRKVDDDSMIIDDDFDVDIDKFISFKNNNQVEPLAMEYPMDCFDNDETVNEIIELMDNVWLEETLIAIGSNERKKSRQELFEPIRQIFLDMAVSGKDDDYEKSKLYMFHESPILLTDNLGPHVGIRTNELLREIDAFGSIRCYNSVRLTQMILMGYTVNVLPIAFVTKSPYSITLDKVFNEQVAGGKRCPVMCTNYLDDDEEILSEVAWTEILRATKTGVVWAETTGLKQTTVVDIA